MIESEIQIAESISAPIIVGYLDSKIFQPLIGSIYESGDIYIYPGLVKHIRKQGHIKEWIRHRQFIPSMIKKPDYMGLNPKEQSIEFYKDGYYLLLAVKWDNDRQYFYVSTFYHMNNGAEKIKKRLRSKRIMKTACNHP